MLIDRGGARVREASMARPVKLPGSQPATAKVRVKGRETHDGVDCGCVDLDRELEVGDELTVEHVCHDGRVDKIVVTVVSITPAPAEHGSTSVRKVLGNDW